MFLAQSEDSCIQRLDTPELTPAKLDAWLAIADVDSEFEAVVAPRHNAIVRYVLWQVW